MVGAQGPGRQRGLSPHPRTGPPKPSPSTSAATQTQHPQPVPPKPSTLNQCPPNPAPQPVLPPKPSTLGQGCPLGGPREHTSSCCSADLGPNALSPSGAALDPGGRGAHRRTCLLAASNAAGPEGGGLLRPASFIAPEPATGPIIRASKSTADGPGAEAAVSGSFPHCWVCRKLSLVVSTSWSPQQPAKTPGFPGDAEGLNLGPLSWLSPSDEPRSPIASLGYRLGYGAPTPCRAPGGGLDPVGSLPSQDIRVSGGPLQPGEEVRSQPPPGKPQAAGSTGQSWRKLEVLAGGHVWTRQVPLWVGGVRGSEGPACSSALETRAVSPAPGTQTSPPTPGHHPTETGQLSPTPAAPCGSWWLSVDWSSG
ncbi:basic salivary proline-rich protein 2-like [Moschus berezovskii]|uniref:basic salivary proline-rich protein 2-like n=1 Tax=Moschus berezovskii TaxID=68408 RepID=UPI002443D0F3|nr:basic salivary proline-rich protein 2-like [Moschus berezovskii]